MQITNVRAVHVRIPLEKPYVFARGTMTAFDNVVVGIETNEDIVGWGESAPLHNSDTGDASTVAAWINEYGDALIGADPFDIELHVNAALEAAEGNVDCVAGIDVALWDLIGKALGQPIYRLIGGKCQDPIAVDYTISSEDPTEMVEYARKMCEQGFQGVVVKVTGKSVEQGIAQVRAVRDALPDQCTVRVDCNGGFQRDGALGFLNGIAGIGVELVEQPLSANDLEGSRACRAVGVPISLDEGLITLADAIAVIRKEACDIMNVKVPRVGGFLLAKRMAAIAEAAGMPVIIGGRTALEISRAASRHLAAATPGAVGIKHEGPGPASQSLSDDVVAKRTSREETARAGGFVAVEQGPGLGIEILEEKLERYAVAG